MNAPARSGPRSVTLRIDSRLDHVELLGRAVRALAAVSGASPRECAHVELALVEAVNNAIRHAYRGQGGHTVEVVFTTHDGRLTLEICDRGTPMPLRPAPSLEFDPTDIPNLPEGGMGLFIIHSVMDRVEYASHDGRNVLTLSRKLAA